MATGWTGTRQREILENVHDTDGNALRTTLTNATVDISVSAFTDSVAIADVSGNKATTTLVSTKRGLDVNVIDITLDKLNDSVSTESVDQSFRLDEVSSSVSYFGYAAIGSAEGSALWKVKKMTVTGTVTKIEYADGNASYDNIWTNRASLSYS